MLQLDPIRFISRFHWIQSNSIGLLAGVSPYLTIGYRHNELDLRLEFHHDCPLDCPRAIERAIAYSSERIICLPEGTTGQTS